MICIRRPRKPGALNRESHAQQLVSIDFFTVPTIRFQVLYVFRSLVAESLLLKHQLLIVNRSRQRTPNLRSSDRTLAGLIALLVRPTRQLRSAIVLKPSTLLAIHKAVSKQKYRMLFSSKRCRKPGPKGPSAELVHAVVEMKQRNPNWGCPRIAQQIAVVFRMPIDKDVVRRILAHHYLPGQDAG